MNITVGPSICFGFDFKHGKEMRIKLNDVITDIKSKSFNNASMINKENYNIEK